MSGASYCFQHNPAVTAEQKRAARSRGGMGRKLIVPGRFLPMKLQTPRDVAALLEETVNWVRAADKLDLKAANTIGFLSGHILKALEASDLEARVDVLEKQLAERGARRR